MLRKTFGKAAASGTFSLAILLASQAEAGWRWHGSSGGGWGGSSGGYGSSGGWGGSSGGYGSSGGGWGGSSGGGGWGKHWHKKWHRWHGGGGSSGGWGGSSGGGWGGSSGGYGSSGGWGGSSGGYGSSGGASYYAPGIDYGGYGIETYPVDPSTTVPAVPAIPGTPEPPLPGGSLPGPSAPAPGGGAAPAETGMRRLDGLLAVNVPEDAKIYVNGQPTSSTGGARQYVSRDLQVGYNYNYEVRAEVVRDGRTVEQVKTVNLRAGDTARVAFDFPTDATPETSLTVHVPADAKVYLAGNPTKASGEKRVFRTTGLSDGKAWNDYVVRVEIERGGRTLSKEETISLKAGQSQELSFDFEADKVAAR
jgi:uncharacterized protein (TIGR03000 family)